MYENSDIKRLNDQLAYARESRRSRDIDWEAEQAARQREMDRMIMERGILIKSFRRASKWEYQGWLAGYLADGGKITHVYDYPWARWSWYIPLENVELVPLYGSLSISIIVPHGIEVTGNPGHTMIFRMEGFTANSIVPIFSDIEF